MSEKKVRVAIIGVGNCASSLVQGETAPASLVNALNLLEMWDEVEKENGRRGLDLIIIGRGGGSFEDLACFNDEVLAGFAGAAADAFSLFERFENKLEEFHGNLGRAAVELAKCAEDKGLRKDYLLPTMDERGVFPRQAVAVGMKAIEQKVARVKMTKEQLFEKASAIINRARQEVDLMMEKGLIPECKI